MAQTIKATAIKPCGHSKMTKAQRNEFKARKWLVYERSWQNAMERCNYVKAVCRTDAELHRHTLGRLARLHSRLEEAYSKEFGRHWINICTDKAARWQKVSIERAA